MKNNFGYLLVQTDDSGEVIDTTDVTEEIIFLYTMIEYQEKIISSYRREFLPEFFPEEQKFLRH